MTDHPPEDVARDRWMVIQATRIIGFALVLLGILLARDVIDLAGDANHLVGYILIVAGLADGFLVPQFLARKWRTPQP